MMTPCLPRNFFSSFWWILSARPDGETLEVGVTDAVVVEAVGGLEIGEAVGACANELIANAREKMETRMNLFISR